MLNIPNLLSIFRILLVPPLVVVLLTKFEGKEHTHISTSKIWRCKDIPLRWPVRVESEFEDGTKSVSEITGYGRGK